MYCRGSLFPHGLISTGIYGLAEQPSVLSQYWPTGAFLKNPIPSGLCEPNSHPGAQICNRDELAGGSD